MSERVTPEQIKQKAREVGFHLVGIAAVADWEPDPVPDPVPDPTPDRSRHQALQDWLNQGFQADMSWMENPQRQSVRSLMPEARSVICVALNYYTEGDRPDGDAYAKISRYGWGRDYHRILHKKLKGLARWLQEKGALARYCADTAPVQDKVWAERAGLGWIAKNSNVITRSYGSWVFLGEVITNLELAPDRPHMAHCGTCTRCLEACPTQAIVRPFVVDANRCIAYHTIENRADSLPSDIAAKAQGWVAGCDICQEVCPWNQRFAQPTDISDFRPRAENLAPTLASIAQLSDEDWDRRFTGSALRRIKPAMLRRNAQAQLQARQDDRQLHHDRSTPRPIDTATDR